MLASHIHLLLHCATLALYLGEEGGGSHGEVMCECDGARDWMGLLKNVQEQYASVFFTASSALLFLPSL